jgi:hypothetical protein
LGFRLAWMFRGSGWVIAPATCFGVWMCKLHRPRLERPSAPRLRSRVWARAACHVYSSATSVVWRGLRGLLIHVFRPWAECKVAEIPSSLLVGAVRGAEIRFSHCRAASAVRTSRLPALARGRDEGWARCAGDSVASFGWSSGEVEVRVWHSHWASLCVV